MNDEISTITQYRNQWVFARYARDFPNNKLSAEKAFNEMVKYLWLSQKHQRDKKINPHETSLDFICSMYPEMREIDDMWHTFLLYTQDYTDFCQKYFGGFMHHTPKTTEQNQTPENFSEEFTRYLTYVYKHLGEETVRIWFAELVVG